ncbi:MAG: S-methyl-5-thioribose-1-phosphate isomerase [Planctomycetota bacterium]|jgi:methylthioribose-1-phosphate isomerase
MNIQGRPYRTIWPHAAGDGSFEVIDQTRLPHELAIRHVTTLDDAAAAIRDMVVRGAPLIGATAAWGLALALHRDASDEALEHACVTLVETRPTAVNLRWAIERVRDAVRDLPATLRAGAARELAARICDEDVAINRGIGTHGLPLLRELHERRGDGGPLSVLTHCNAGWLATVDWGTALAPIYMAHDAGLPVHVWVDETRPRSQGARLTAWELQQHGVPFTVVVDGAAGHLMQHGRVDCCITGTDRTTCAGDVCNKIGTYHVALAARDNDVPFYVALPGPTIDWDLADGRRIPIEQRDATEVTDVGGRTPDGAEQTVRIVPEGSAAANFAFDVTPARLVTALITERGVCPASRAGLSDLYPEKEVSTSST